MPANLTNANAPADGETLLWACDQRDPRTLAGGLLNDARNLRYADGLPTTRKGVVKPGWANRTSPADQLIDSLGTPYGSGVFQDPNGLEWQLVAAGGLVWRSRPHNQASTIPLPPGVAILSACKPVQAFDRVFLFRGQYLPPLVMTNFDLGFEDLVPHYDATLEYQAAVVATGTAAAEMAFGPYQAVTSITRVGFTATAITTAAHGYLTGADVEIRGAVETEYNGRVNITVLDDYTFTFAVYGNPATPATGTITVSNMLNYWRAKGTQITLTSLTAVGSTVTATETAHGFSSGQYVTITGATPAAYNGTFPITVLTADTFEYEAASAPGGSGSGTMKAQTSIVFAGQTPESNPEAWARTYNILPNAKTAIFINDLLLVATAFEPASVDDYATFTGGTYKKTDYLVATNYLDYIHFSFQNEFRINSGSADEIVDLFKIGEGTVIVLKGGSWGVLSNVQLDLAQISFDLRSTEYGCAAQGAWAVSGSNGYFLSSGFGVVQIRQSDLGKLLGVNVPLSAPVTKFIGGIDWTKIGTARMVCWNSRMYLAVPMKDGTPTIGVFDFVASVRLGNNWSDSGVTTQGWTPVDTGSALQVVEWHKLKLNGEERLFFLDPAGYVNLMEESDNGDQIASATGSQGLAWEEIESYALSRTYDNSLKGQVRPHEEAISMMTFDPTYTVRVIFAGVGVATTLLTGCVRDNTKYFKPFDQPRWVPSNINDDWATPYRQDYHVDCARGSLIPAGRIAADTYALNLTPNLEYKLTVSNAVLAVFFGSFDRVSNSFVNGRYLPVVQGVPYTFTSTPTGAPALPVRLVIASADTYVEATLWEYGLVPNCGLMQFQEALDTRRASGRQGKSYQLEFTNTTGRIKLVGQRVSAVAGRDNRGIST